MIHMCLGCDAGTVPLEVAAVLEAILAVSSMYSGGVGGL